MSSAVVTQPQSEARIKAELYARAYWRLYLAVGLWTTSISGLTVLFAH